jgi:hypothetical protein
MWRCGSEVPISAHCPAAGLTVAIDHEVSHKFASGFDTAPEDLLRWYAAAASVHYAPLAAFFGHAARDPAALEARFNRPIDAIARDRARVVERAVELGESVLEAG